MPPPPEQDNESLLPRPRNTVATNLPVASSTTFKPKIPRRFRHPTSSKNKKKQARPRSSTQSPSVDEDAALFSSLSALSDGLLALETLHAAWPHEATHKLSRTPPLVLLSQLRALVADTNALERDLARMVAHNVWRKIELPRGDVAYVRTADVQSATEGCGPTLHKFANELLPDVRDSVLPLWKLKQTFVGADADAAETEIVRAGWLTMRDASTFWFAVPGVGAFCTQREAGKKEVLGVVKRAPYSEMLLTKVEGRSLRKSCFTAQWHVRDIVGGGLAETVETSVGTLVRIRDGN